MKVVIAPDKFKGSLTAEAVSTIISQALNHLGLSEGDIKKVPMADGGDGSLALLAPNAERVEVVALDAAATPHCMGYAICDGGRAVIESAEVIGLANLSPSERKPLRNSSRGLGEVIADAIMRGVNEVDISLGGVATCDGGAGMLAALGVQFFDHDDNPIEPLPTLLKEISRIDCSALASATRSIRFRALCDVRNPLLGSNGASYIYAPQKGASPAEVALLEEALTHLSAVAERHLGWSEHQTAGSGAAGGLGWALRLFLRAEIVSGAEVIGEIQGLEEAIGSADLVITGEGRIDGQTEEGKVVNHIRGIAARLGKPCVIYCGEALTPLPECYALTDTHTREEALSNAENLLYDLVCRTFVRYLR